VSLGFLFSFLRSLFVIRGFGEGDGEGEALCDGDATAATGAATFAFAG
jgi:hypothetical protein